VLASIADYYSAHEFIEGSLGVVFKRWLLLRSVIAVKIQIKSQSSLIIS
jgi:hypothetical protein